MVLPKTAHARGYAATQVNHHGLHRSKDWEILKLIEEEDWVLVTDNAIEFQGRLQQLEL